MYGISDIAAHAYPNRTYAITRAMVRQCHICGESAHMMNIDYSDNQFGLCRNHIVAVNKRIVEMIDYRAIREAQTLVDMLWPHVRELRYLDERMRHENCAICVHRREKLTIYNHFGEICDGCRIYVQNALNVKIQNMVAIMISLQRRAPRDVIRLILGLYFQI
jgi:hypothetical protein